MPNPSDVHEQEKKKEPRYEPPQILRSEPLVEVSGQCTKGNTQISGKLRRRKNRARFT